MDRRVSKGTGVFLNANRRESLAHYVLIYLMIAMGDSFLYDRVLVQLCPLIAVVLLVAVALNRKTQYVYPFSILGFASLAMLFVRTTAGGVGPSEILTWTAMICITVVSVGFNISKFLERLVKLVAFLASLSLLVYSVSVVIPGVWSHFTPFAFPLTFGVDYWIDSATKISTSYYQAHGLLLYVDRGFDLERNVGIFREPAVYQILLNSVLFVLLYMCPEALKSKRRWLIALLFITVLTTKSATGYLSMLVLLFAYTCGTGEEGRRVPAVVLVFAGMGIVFFLVLLLFGDSSWLAGTVFGRFIGSEGFAMDASGSARMGAAKVSLGLILENPLGCGYDIYSTALDTGSTGYVAACLLKVAAVYGIAFAIAAVIWVLYPVLAKSCLPVPAKVAFVLMYVLATYYENEIFYTTLIFIPVFLYLSSIQHTGSKKMRGARLIGFHNETEE